MGNKFNERVIATVESSTDGRARLENKVRVMLDQIVERLETAGGLPYGMVLEGRITLDHHGNRSLYVFLKLKDETFPGNDLRWNSSPDQIPESVGGKWISLNDRGLNSFNAEWESRDLRQAITHYKAGILTAEAARQAHREKEEAEQLAFRARLAEKEHKA